MSLDRSLKGRSSLERHRNVLNRAERIKQLTDLEKFDGEKNRPVGLPKVAHRKAHVGAKTAKKEAGEGGDAAGAAAAPAKADAGKKDAGKKDAGKK